MRATMIVFLVGIGAGICHAEPASRPIQGFLAAGGGFYSNPYASGRVLQVAGGGDAPIAGGISVGGEIGLLGGGGDAAVPLAVDATYHIAIDDRRVSPFLRAGFTRIAWLTETTATNALDIGGGVISWFGSRRGVLFEVLDSVYRSLGTDHILTFRVGLAFR